LGAYLARRFLLMLLTLFGISIIIFLMLRVMPGNIVDILYDAAGYVNPREKAKIEAELGLDKPIVVQYATWISGLAQGDLGYSYVSERPALAPQVHLSGQMQASGFTEPLWLIQRDGQFLQVSQLLYRVAELANGERTLGEIAARFLSSVSIELGQMQSGCG